MTSVERFPLPPEWMVQSIGGGDYRAIGQHFFELFRQYGGLNPDSATLDIGSGCGRLAIPLIDYLDPETAYHGVDIVKPMVDWCVETITPTAANFRFHHAELANSLYSEVGTPASEYRFEFDDGTFDFIFATSVFTHLRPDDARNYLREVARLLRKDGAARAVLTFFIMNDVYRQNRSTANPPKVTFEHGGAPYWVNDPDVPESICAYDEAFLFEMVREAGLILSQVSFGKWNHCRGWTFQDVLVVSA